MFDAYEDANYRPATIAEEHADWHVLTGNPIGKTTCPWDACHPYDDEPYGDEDDEPADDRSDQAETFDAVGHGHGWNDEPPF